jgi:hypothetical protein
VENRSKALRIEVSIACRKLPSAVSIAAQWLEPIPMS